MKRVLLLATLCAAALLSGMAQAFSFSSLRRDPANLSDAQIVELLRDGGFSDPQRRQEELCAWVFAERRSILELILKAHPNGWADFPLLSCAPSQAAYDFWKSKGAVPRLLGAAWAVNVPAVAAHLADEADGADARQRQSQDSDSPLGLALESWRKAVEGLDPVVYHHVLVQRYSTAGSEQALAKAAANGEMVVRMLLESGASLDEATPAGRRAQLGMKDAVPGETYRSAFAKYLDQSGLDRAFYASFRTVWPLLLKAEAYGREIQPLRAACRDEDEAACQQVLDKADPASPVRTVAGQQLARLVRERTEWSALLGQESCKLRFEKWVYVGSDCAAGLAHGSGSAVRWRTGSRFLGEFVNGSFAHGKLVRQDGTPVFDGRFHADGSYASGRVYIDGKPAYEGDFKAGDRHGQGLCWVGGAAEECRYLAGERIDVLHKQRLENAQLRKDLAEERRVAQERAAEQARHQRRQQEEDAADERKERRFAQALGATAAAMRGDYRAAAQAGVIGADTLLMQQRQHAREQQFLIEQRLLQQAAENSRREQAQQQARQQAQQSSQDQEQQRRSADALAAREAELKRVQETQASAARRDAERLKAQQERQAEQAQQAAQQAQAKADYLAAVKGGTQLKAVACHGQHYVTGVRPKVKVPAGLSSCVDVSVTAWCLGDRVGRAVTASNFVGMSGCLGDTYKIDPQPACAAETMRVVVETVESCR